MTATPRAPAGTAATALRERVSLLWPAGRQYTPGRARLEDATVAELDLDEVVMALTGRDRSRRSLVAGLLCELQTDPQTITYRQEVLADLLADANLRDGLKGVAADLAALGADPGPRLRNAWSVAHIAYRLEVLERYVAVSLRLLRTLETGAPRSAALLTLRQALEATVSGPQFRALQEEAPALRRTLERATSVTIGINLTRDLLPEGAALLAVSPERVENRTPLLERLLGRGRQRPGERGPLSPIYNVDVGNPDNPLFRDLRKLLEATVAPVADALGRYAEISTAPLVALEPEIVFLLNASALTRRLSEAGLPVCRPEIAPPDDRLLELEDGYNAALALRVVAGEAPAAAAPGGVVTNPISLDGATRIWILTGPNRGGKTTYTRAVGQAQVLFQAGLFLPATRARLSPADAVYSHFPVAEGAGRGRGRLDEEAARLGQIFQTATPRSLILLNEVLAGTSAIEALGLAYDAVRGLRLLGARAVYTTHLHELAARVGEINATTPGDSGVGSLVADVADEGAADEGAATAAGATGDPQPDAAPAAPAVIGPQHRRTFRILPSPPRNVSYASEIAEQHGISYPQLQHLLNRRGITPP
jgi:hypothetical protein